VWRFLDTPAPVAAPYYVLSLGYSALDFSTLDPHWGRRDEWRSMIDAVHARDMYYVVDFTIATMADLLAWEG
jgi:alpha-1,3-glucan synthase